VRLIGVHHINGRKYGRISSTAPPVLTNVGKGGSSASLPNRAAVHSLTNQTAGQSALGNYSKMTPGIGSGGNAFSFGKMPDITKEEA
jgi:hypothetical protein